MPVKRRAEQDASMRIDGETEAYRLSLAATINRLRLDAELSMNRLGESAGLSQPMIGLIERGIHTPTISTLFRIARSLGTTPAKLLAEVETGQTSATSKSVIKAKTAKKIPVSTSTKRLTKATKAKKRPKPL